MNELNNDSSPTTTAINWRPPCLALIWLKGPSTIDERARIRDSMLTRPGVVSAEPSARSANVLMVRFDRDCTSALNIVAELRRAGLPAVLVGC